MVTALMWQRLVGDAVAVAALHQELQRCFFLIFLHISGGMEGSWGSLFDETVATCLTKSEWLKLLKGRASQRENEEARQER